MLSSSFSKENLEYILSLDTSVKNNKYIILNSPSWIKGVPDCIKYAKENNLEYELVSGLSHRNCLKKLAESKGIIFFPKGHDTCPRMSIEAKLLDCDLILNDYVQHKDEPWFENKESIIRHIEQQKRVFFDTCLDFDYDYKKVDSKLKFHFIVPSFNAEEWLPNTVMSIKRQAYENYSVTVVDDVSTDATYQTALKSCLGDSRFKVIKNKEKKYALRNISEAIDSIDMSDDDIIIVLDGDDWLASSGVLNYLARVYEEEDILLTYGSYITYPRGTRGVEPSKYPDDIINKNLFRKDVWRASHLRTFKYSLWKEINKGDLRDVDGEYYKMAYDQAMMLPMLEMAGTKIKYIDDILHVYNRATPYNVDKKMPREQHETMVRIREKAVYPRKF